MQEKLHGLLLGASIYLIFFVNTPVLLKTKAEPYLTLPLLHKDRKVFFIS
jgi:hypothetical protein